MNSILEFLHLRLGVNIFFFFFPLMLCWKFAILAEKTRNDMKTPTVFQELGSRVSRLPGHIPEIWVQGRNMLVWMKIADLHYLSLCDPSCPHLLHFYNGMFFMNCRMSWVEPDRFKTQMLHFASLKVWPKALFLSPNNLILITNDFVCVVVSSYEKFDWLLGFLQLKGKSEIEVKLGARASKLAPICDNT